MAWYNLWKSNKQDSNTELYCSNPQCGRIMDDGPIVYDAERGKIYHSNYYNCILEGMSHMVMQIGVVMTGNLDYITRDQALKLLASGKIKPREDLESKIT